MLTCQVVRPVPGNWSRDQGRPSRLTHPCCLVHPKELQIDPVVVGRGIAQMGGNV